MEQHAIEWRADHWSVVCDAQRELPACGLLPCAGLTEQVLRKRFAGKRATLTVRVRFMENPDTQHCARSPHIAVFLVQRGRSPK